MSQYHCVYGLNKLTSPEVSVYFIVCFFPHIGENVVVVINVREEIRKFRNKEESEPHKLQQTIFSSY